jgi:hypothetical protein
VQLFLRSDAHAPETTNRQRVQEGNRLLRSHDYQPIGLPKVTGQLGQELVRGYSHGSSQGRFGPNTLLDLLSDLWGPPE